MRKNFNKSLIKIAEFHKYLNFFQIYKSFSINNILNFVKVYS